MYNLNNYIHEAVSREESYMSYNGIFRYRWWYPVGAALVAAFTTQSTLAAIVFATINLVTDDQTANSAQISDPNLISAWGMSFSSSGPFWI